MNKTILIEGMMCQNCAKHVYNAFKEIGVEAKVNLEEKKAILTNTDIDDKLIIETIENAGYEVKEIINE